MSILTYEKGKIPPPGKRTPQGRHQYFNSRYFEGLTSSHVEKENRKIS